jgi:hypothetical protein
MDKLPNKELIDSIKHISDNLEAINNTLSTPKPEIPEHTETNEWGKRVEPLIEEVNRICKKKWFTTRRKFQIAIIGITSFVIGIAVILLQSSANSAIMSSAHLMSLLTPDNQTVIIGNETIPQSQINELTYTLNQIPVAINLAFSVIAILVTIFAIVVPLIFGTSTSQDLSEEYFIQISKNKQADDKPYIKALVNLKCREFHVDLMHVYHTNPELFAPSSLIMRLYNAE